MAFQRAIDEFGELAREFEQSWALYDAEAVAAVDAFRKDQGLDYPGNPSGLVDRALVEALHATYRARD